MTYKEARVYLDEMSKYGSVLGLDTIRGLLRELGNPQESLKFIHIAGTNGKGSVLAYTSTILSEAGYRIGRYVSPTVISYLERIQMNGRWISEEEFAELTEKVKEAIARLKAAGENLPTVFETETAIAFLYFRKMNCDFVVLETGLGGELDATNIVKNTVCAVFATISRDHLGVIGNTLEEIAQTKAGIIKNGCAVVSAQQKETVSEILKKRAEASDCSYREADLSRFLVEKEDYHGIRFSYKEYKNLRGSLAGECQIANLATALEVIRTLNALGISGLAISIVDDREKIPQKMIDKAVELKLPLFYVRWEGATFVDIAQSIGQLILETNITNKRTGDYLYNLLFGYEVNDKYIEKISSQFGLAFDRAYRVGIIVIDRKYGINLEQDEHTYLYYTDCLNREVMHMENRPMYMRFLNKFVLLFEATEDKETERQIEQLLKKLDSRPQFAGLIHSTCILGAAYTDPSEFGKSYQEAKNLIPKKDYLPNPTNKKVLSASSMGIYKYMFNNGNQQEILDYCNDKLKKLEMYDQTNGAFLVETLLAYYMSGFNVGKTAEALYIHRNSLQYRLKKIEEILEVDLEDSMEYLDIVNCILVKRLMFN